MKTQLEKSVCHRIQSSGNWILIVFLCLPGVLKGQAFDQQAAQKGQAFNDPAAPKGQAIDDPAAPKGQAIESAAADSVLSNQALIDEINAIRNQLGGGIRDQLRDLDFGKQLEIQLKNDFERELNRLAVQDAGNHKPGVGQKDSNFPGAAPPSDRPYAIGPGNREGHPQHPDVPFRFEPRTGVGPGFGPPPRMFNFHRPIGHESAYPSQNPDSRAPGAHRSSNPVGPLRSAARRIDQIAADLEEVGLYAEADSAREQARRFWLNARQLENNGQSANHPRNR